MAGSIGPIPKWRIISHAVFSVPLNQVEFLTQPGTVKSGAGANRAVLYHHAENGYFSHKARIRYPQWLARLPGQYSPEGTGSAIHYDLNTMAM